jgi:hypothetical protein
LIFGKNCYFALRPEHKLQEPARRFLVNGYFWGPEVLSKDFLKPVKEEFGVGHAA